MQPDCRDIKPVYEQITDGIRKMIITHAIPEGEKLPSVRELASKFAINPNAVRKAYQELEEEGYVCDREGERMAAVLVLLVFGEVKTEFADAAPGGGERPQIIGHIEPGAGDLRAHGRLRATRQQPSYRRQSDHRHCRRSRRRLACRMVRPHR